jgi:transglutaminase-like putative cysteine protease
MLIRVGYDIRFDVPHGANFLALLRAYPSRQSDLLSPDFIGVDPAIPISYYEDSFGNIAARFTAPPGPLTLSASTVVRDSGMPDPIAWGAPEIPIDQLPSETLLYLLSSRYCEVDLMASIANDLFGSTPPGWSRVQAICNWVNTHVVFDYSKTRPTKTALDVYTERVGVCRDFQHLAITLCRAMNIPARYATGYLGDIGVPLTPTPMDFSAWFEAYLDNRWYTFDARHNQPRIGRILMAVGRDATDVAITTTFGEVTLTKFVVVSEEVEAVP